MTAEDFGEGAECGFKDQHIMEGLQFSTKYLLKPEAEALFMKQIMQLHKTRELEKEKANIIFKEKIELAKNESKEKGIKLGEKKGKLEIAKAMLSKGYPVDDIVALTGLSIKQVEQLRQVD